MICFTTIFLLLLLLLSIGAIEIESESSIHKDSHNLRILQGPPCASEYSCGDGKYFIYHKNRKIRCLAEVDAADHLAHGDTCGCGPITCPTLCSAVSNSTCTYTDDLGVTHDDGQTLCHKPYRKAKSICMSDEQTLKHQLAHGLRLGDYCVTDENPCVSATCASDRRPKGCPCETIDDCISRRCRLKKGTQRCR